MAMNDKANTLAEVATPAIPKETNDDLTIVAGTREKRRILDEYERHLGLGYFDSIVTIRNVSKSVLHLIYNCSTSA